MWKAYIQKNDFSMSIHLYKVAYLSIPLCSRWILISYIGTHLRYSFFPSHNSQNAVSFLELNSQNKSKWYQSTGSLTNSNIWTQCRKWHQATSRRSTHEEWSHNDYKSFYLIGYRLQFSRSYRINIDHCLLPILFSLLVV